MRRERARRRCGKSRGHVLRTRRTTKATSCRATVYLRGRARRGVVKAQHKERGVHEVQVSLVGLARLNQLPPRNRPVVPRLCLGRLMNKNACRRVEPGFANNLQVEKHTVASAVPGGKPDHCFVVCGFAKAPLLTCKVIETPSCRQGTLLSMPQRWRQSTASPTTHPHHVTSQAHTIPHRTELREWRRRQTSRT